MAIEAIYGLGLGYMAATADKGWREVAQGGNHYLGAANQEKSLMVLSVLVNRILRAVPNSSIRLVASTTNAILPVAGLVICPLSAAVKQGHYENGVIFLDQFCPRIGAIAPKKLDSARVKLFSFISDHLSQIATAGIAAGTIALPLFGFGSLAMGMAIPVGIRQLESANMLPTTLSLWYEKYMPTAVNASMLMGGGIFSQAFAAVSIAISTPQINDFFQKKLETTVLKRMQKQGATLEEIDAPWEERNHLTYEEILHILNNCDEDLFKVNPAHCTKEACKDLMLPEDHDFNKLLTIFNQIDWIARYPTLKRSFRDDDRFIAMIRDNYPLLTDEELYDDFETHVEKLASKDSLSKEEYLAKQIKEQMQCLVALLNKKQVPKGTQHDLDDAIQACSHIVAYLTSGKASVVDAEDFLLKLAVEGGDYCTRGVKRCSKEIVEAIACSTTSELDDPLKRYELNLYQILEMTRKQIMQNLFQQSVGLMVQMSKEGMSMRYNTDKPVTDAHAVSISEDVHALDMYHQYFALGFYPITENERSRYTIKDMIQWSMYGAVRNQLYLLYQSTLDQAFKQVGEVHFTQYIRQKIASLPQLTPDQQEEIIDKLTMCEEGETTLKGFRRLCLVMMGVLKIDMTYTEMDWESIEEPEETKDWILV